MNNEALKLELIKNILNTKDSSVIKELVILLNEDKKITTTETLNEENSDYNTSLINTKLHIIERVVNLEDKNTISKLETTLNKNDFWNELSDSQKEEIESGIKYLEEGKKISLDDFVIKYS